MGSSPTPRTSPEPPASTAFADWLLETKRNAYTTIECKLKILRRLNKHVNLWNAKEVERRVVRASWTNGYKNNVFSAYADWCTFKGFQIKPKKYPKEHKLPYIPTEGELDQLIAGCGPNLACFLQILKESGFRPIEAFRLTHSDFDLARGICTLNKPAKNSLPRQFKMTGKLLSILARYLLATPKNGRIWGGKLRHLRRNFSLSRRSLANKLANSNLEKITFKTFRHWKATTEYHKTKDILHVKRLLGHKRIENTLIYTHLISKGLILKKRSGRKSLYSYVGPINRLTYSEKREWRKQISRWRKIRFNQTELIKWSGANNWWTYQEKMLVNLLAQPSWLDTESGEKWYNDNKQWIDKVDSIDYDEDEFNRLYFEYREELKIMQSRFPLDFKEWSKYQGLLIHWAKLIREHEKDKKKRTVPYSIRTKRVGPDLKSV